MQQSELRSRLLTSSTDHLVWAEMTTPQRCSQSSCRVADLENKPTHADAQKTNETNIDVCNFEGIFQTNIQIYMDKNSSNNNKITVTAAATASASTESQSIRWCFEPSQQQSITSGSASTGAAAPPPTSSSSSSSHHHLEQQHYHQ